MLCIRVQIKYIWVLGIILHLSCVNVVVGAFNNALEHGEFVGRKCLRVAFVQSIQLPLTHLHCSYEIADEYIAFLGEGNQRVQGLNYWK